MKKKYFFKLLEQVVRNKVLKKLFIKKMIENVFKEEKYFCKQTVQNCTFLLFDKWRQVLLVKDFTIGALTDFLVSIHLPEASTVSE